MFVALAAKWGGGEHVDGPTDWAGTTLLKVFSVVRCQLHRAIQLIIAYKRQTKTPTTQCTTHGHSIEKRARRGKTAGIVVGVAGTHVDANVNYASNHRVVLA